MKNATLGDVIIWKGKLSKIIGEFKERAVVIQSVEKCKCPHCDKELEKKQSTIIVSSILFQQNAEAITTLTDNSIRIEQITESTP